MLHKKEKKNILPMTFPDQDLMKYTARKKPYETVHNVQKIDKLLRSAVVKYNLHPSLGLLS